MMMVCSLPSPHGVADPDSLPLSGAGHVLLPPPVFEHAARLSGIELEEESVMLPSPDSSSCDGLHTVGGVLLPLHAVATGAGVADSVALT